MIQRIVVIGNVAAGKTRLSQSLARIHDLPLTHIDSIQFLPGMKIRPLDETRKALNEITAQEKWLIDGYGPLDILEKRFALADRIVFIDFPLWRHYWWVTKRQITNLWSPRKELPTGCNELTFEHTQKLFKTLKQVHTKMRPELVRILNRDNMKSKTLTIHTLKEWNQVFREGIR
jgi:hypothetical protein